MAAFTVDELNEAWVCERVINLFDEGKKAEAQALSSEWGFTLDGLTFFLKMIEQPQAHEVEPP